MKVIVVGASYGGMEAIKTLLSALPENFKVPVIVVLHIGNNSVSGFLGFLNKNTTFKVKEAGEKEKISPKTVYFAPPNYHLQLEADYSLSLSTDAKVNFSRPSIDVLFETAAWTCRNDLTGILLTGSNSDGSAGLQTIQKYGGITIVENPETAFAKAMPSSAIELFKPDFVLNIDEIAEKLVGLSKMNAST
jgi:two-component system, chemotaxis family, protein-glutamate methylesterase/glutaminase